MDAKITKQRLTRMLSYDWVKIVLCAVAIIFFWSLVLTTSATRITPAQNFYVYNHQSNLTFRDKFYTHLDQQFQGGTFSYEIIETTQGDMVAAGDQADTVMQARLSVSEGDVMFVADIADKNYMETNAETGEVTAKYTYVESFVGSYYYALYEFNGENGYFAQLEAFLNEYYGGDYKTGVLNEEKAKADFRARITRTKDKRFKKESQILEGEKAEVERIKKYKAALEEFNGYLAAGLVEFKTVDLELSEGWKVQGDYAINICPDEEKTPYLKEYVAYATPVTDENGVTTNIATAKDMHVCFFRFEDMEKSFEFEDLVYLNSLIRVVIKTA